MPKCANCVQRVEIRSGARFYYKCDWLNEFIPITLTTCLKNCPLKKEKR